VQHILYFSCGEPAKFVLKTNQKTFSFFEDDANFPHFLLIIKTGNFLECKTQIGTKFYNQNFLQ
jgi:hypothetical protein